MDFTVLESRRFIAVKCDSYDTITRVVKDFEIDLELSNGREYSINGDNYVIKSGDLCIRFPGQTLTAKGWQDSYILTLDFSGERKEKGYSRNIAEDFQSEIKNPEIQKLRNVIHINQSNYVRDLYENIIGFIDKNDARVKTLVSELLYIALANNKHMDYLENKTKNTIVDKAFAIIKDKFATDISLSDIANECHVDKSYLIRVFKNRFGKTPIEYLIQLRLEQARDLLLSTNATIEKIAYSCGYKTTSFFIGEYKKRYGLTPKAYRDRYFC